MEAGDKARFLKKKKEMSVGIYFTADIRISGYDFGENIHQVREAIRDLKEENQDYKERMLMMLMGGVSSVCLKDCEGYEMDGVDVLHRKFTELLMEYENNIKTIANLESYEEYLKEKQKKWIS